MSQLFSRRDQELKKNGHRTSRTRAGKLRTAGPVVVAGMLALSGCSETGSPVPLYPVKGSVTYQGETPAGAFLVFHPKTPVKAGVEIIRPSAQVQADGSFRLSSLTQGDGAPAGDYDVTIEWHKAVRQGQDLVPGPNVIPASYAKPETTPLKITVQQNANELPPLEVTKQAAKAAGKPAQAS